MGAAAILRSSSAISGTRCFARPTHRVESFASMVHLIYEVARVPG